MVLRWIPEVPGIALYRARVPERTGKLGEVEWLVTASAWDALWFATRTECEAWIAANPHPVFVAREHGFIRPQHVEAD